MQELVKMVTDRKFGFCGGVAILAIQVPPYWQEWLAGELSELQIGLWMGAAAAVARGILWAIFAAIGEKVPESLKAKENQ
jgi:hypothetical protein